jgi:quercetin dioxygenase-like cupin family protein
MAIAKGKKTSLAGLADYRKGCVVSQEVIKKAAGSVTVFAFDAGQGLSEHTAPFDALVFVLDGEAKIVISGKTHKLGVGQAIIMPAHKPHSLKAVKQFKMLLIMIRS